jgi:hypothetical protein
MIITSFDDLKKSNGRVKTSKVDFELNTGETGTFIIADIGASGRNTLNDSFAKMVDLNSMDINKMSKGEAKLKFKENASFAKDNILVVSLGVVDDKDNRILDSDAGREYIGSKIISSEVEKIALEIMKISGMDKDTAKKK